MFGHEISLLSMSIEEARNKKWDIGQVKYGPVFVGNPIEQLDCELLDAMNYSDEMDRQGMGIAGLKDELIGICTRIRAHHKLLSLGE